MTVEKQSTSEGRGYVMTSTSEKVCAVTDAQTLDKMTREAQFSCARCGAKANDESSVCDPVAIEPDH